MGRSELIETLRIKVLEFLRKHGNDLESYNCSSSEFRVICQCFKTEFIEKSFESLQNDDWEGDIVLMATEGGFKGWFWNNKKHYNKYMLYRRV